MGFWDNYESDSGLSYIGAEEKAAIIKNGQALTVVRVFHGTGQWGPKYTAVFDIDGEERALSFTAGSVESRDRLFDALIEYLEGDEEEPVQVKLVKNGRSVLVEQA